MSVKYYRSNYDVIYGRDNELSIFPDAGLCPDLEVMRYRAIAEVLRRIPEEAYKKLVEKVEEFLWFVPPKDQFGLFYPFPATRERQIAENGMEERERAEVIYLSPELEEEELDVVIVVVAHELAHVYAGHNTVPPNPDDIERNEKEAWQLVQKWGFNKEYKFYMKYWKKEATGSRKLYAPASRWKK